ncbi:SDR family oxidoreductase [Niveispirillum fermenti]|uniref:SDR family oxidoreductase n=1 Tax=Niveispirillum fermenti TaxID=1233113 RepID=UPI003A8696B7
MPGWTNADIPAQTGRSAVVTGTGGLGFQTARALAKAGCGVVVAGRNPDKGAAAIAAIRRELPDAAVRFERLDLASLASVQDFAARLCGRQDSLDLLINNAGVMVPPKRQQTEDGFEQQFGTNHLGHFALTGHLMPLLRRARDARVITLSSIAARKGRIDFDDLDAQRHYRPMPVYSQSKLACLMFSLELQRRSVAAGWNIASIAAHPGISRTDLLHNAPGRWSGVGMMRSLLWFMFQPAAQGALPALFAATSPQAEGGGYYGPDRMNETRGFPTLAMIPPQALDPVASARLWEVSRQMTGATF